MEVPRGIRNNNPLNIRKTPAKWFGKVEGKDPEFETFDTMEHGIRAAYMIVRTYLTTRGCKTIADIVRRWAPPGDHNDTYHYIRRVGKYIRLDVTTPTCFENCLLMARLLHAMHIVENGNNFIPIAKFIYVYNFYFRGAHSDGL